MQPPTPPPTPTTTAAPPPPTPRPRPTPAGPPPSTSRTRYASLQRNRSCPNQPTSTSGACTHSVTFKLIQQSAHCTTDHGRSRWLTATRPTSARVGFALERCGSKVTRLEDHEEVCARTTVDAIDDAPPALEVTAEHAPGHCCIAWSKDLRVVMDVSRRVS